MMIMSVSIDQSEYVSVTGYVSVNRYVSVTEYVSVNGSHRKLSLKFGVKIFTR